MLAIDLDPQSNLTMSQGIDPDDLERSMFDVLVHKTPIEEIIASCEVDLAVSSIDLAGAELAMSSMIGRERALDGIGDARLVGLRDVVVVLDQLEPCSRLLARGRQNSLVLPRHVAEELQRGLQVQRRRVVARRADVRLAQPAHQHGIPVGRRVLERDVVGLLRGALERLALEAVAQQVDALTERRVEVVPTTSVVDVTERGRRSCGSWK